MVAGTVLGYLLITPPYDDWLQRYPALGSIDGFLLTPAMWLTNAWAAMRLPPHGDAGFVVMMIFMVGVWSVYGLFIGLLLEWRLKRWKAVSKQEQHGEGANFLQHCSRFVKRHKTFCVSIVVLFVAVCGYCVAREFALSKDREFFVKHVNHKAVAEACVDVLTNRVKYPLPFGSDSGKDPKSDPNVPEVIRLLHPRSVVMRGEELSITKTDYNYLILRHNWSDPDRYDLVYQEGPTSPGPEALLYSVNISVPLN
jgi:hypothetical protein